MRHGDKVNNLGRTAEHRRALLANLANALIEHKRIVTTLAKAKALRRFIEPLVTRAKKDNTHNRRIVFSHLQNKHSVKELFGNIIPEVNERPGGYVRVIRLGFRRGDGAETALIEFVDFNKDYNLYEGKEKKKAKKTRRGGRKSRSTAAATAAEQQPVEAAPEAAEATADTAEQKEAEA
ncbi:MAG: 50S ribosomal protein L17 [Saprospiraceae bacterium]|nr:50S ribosomal protein L17 [Saprospiraceae bacterium]MDW8229489.1 50S ribosomal protein L17 [Saprospiraceae bacterium]